MRNPRICLDMDLAREGLVELPEESLHYLTRVLRLPDGAPCRVFDGQGLERHARLLVRGKRAAALELGSIAAAPTTPRLSIHLLLAIIKTDAMDYAIQKAVEVGVSTLYPVLTERSLSAQGHRNIERRREHWLGVIRSACEQSGRNELPELNPAQDLYEAMAGLPTRGLRVVASADGLHWREWWSSMETMADHTVTLLIGPEGGLTTSELALARNQGFRSVALGPRTLRAETAAVVALTTLQLLCGGWDLPT
jgi:16S rRNA (uracil1498-N3)-methyltransferase